MKKNLWKTIFKPEIILISLALTAIHGSSLSLLPFSLVAQAQTVPVAGAFSPPLGFGDGLSYEPRITYNNEGQLIENTDYGVKNPDMQGETCFGVNFEQIYHAGEDWYRADGESTVGAEVTAVADGIVAFADPNMNYPGLVVIIEHALASGQKIYSVYAHLDDSSLEVEAGQIVRRGQRLGEVMYQDYTGRYPEYHPSGDDSHLHYELRDFYSGRNIYANQPGCNGLIPGRGYTYPEIPDNFPASEPSYNDPMAFIQGRLATQ
jgi:murein DD-endopeptidase MepM/ murein hydrolase activator NlpD